MAVNCPECETPVMVDVDDVEEGDTVVCEECGSDLEIVSLDPLKVTVVDDSGYDDPEETVSAREEDDGY